MAKTSKFFRVAIEGDTCDGRVIARKDLEDMAATYNRDTYGARVNMEHIRGYTPEGPFKAYGDVLALKTDDVQIELGGKTVTRRALFAQIDPTDELVAITGARQKIFTSIEINPDFASSGKAYLQGLAVTDSPASLGTEILQFAAAQGDNNPFNSRKLHPGNVFSAAIETKIEWEEPAAPADPTTGIFSKLDALLTKFTGGTKPEEPKPPVTPPAPGNDNDPMAAFSAAIAEGFTELRGAVQQIGTRFATDIATLRADQDALKASIETTEKPGQQPRPRGTGAGHFALADC
ncbi:GPO family capsid scaffolding protein [Flavisphingomonas formosensis]|uniref:GPO family capsid scaffolding protein n=1 Tax=Flavisphingomonas formosensis TaxID=861534 RepID=UPI0012F8CC31|nr:GPO family capsid scaffolding protein [Sphingomonas formosensis]